MEDPDRYKYDYIIITDESLEFKGLNWEQWQEKAKELYEMDFQLMRVYAFSGEKFIRSVDFRRGPTNWINLSRRKT